jgi:hypothetical protein
MCLQPLRQGAAAGPGKIGEDAIRTQIEIRLVFRSRIPSIGFRQMLRFIAKSERMNEQAGPVRIGDQRRWRRVRGAA